MTFSLFHLYRFPRYHHSIFYQSLSFYGSAIPGNSLYGLAFCPCGAFSVYIPGLVKKRIGDKVVLVDVDVLRDVVVELDVVVLEVEVLMVVDVEVDLVVLVELLVVVELVDVEVELLVVVEEVDVL